MWLSVTEKVGKDKTHYKERKKGRKNAPYHTQIGIFIFLFKVSFHKLGEEKPVLFKYFNIF